MLLALVLAAMIGSQNAAPRQQLVPFYSCQTSEEGIYLLNKIFEGHLLHMSKVISKYEHADQDAAGVQSRVKSSNPAIHAKLQAFRDHMKRSSVELKRLWEGNALVLEQMLKPMSPVAAIRAQTSADLEMGSDPGLMEQQYDTADQLLYHMIRDWSVEGHALREKTYQPLVQALLSWSSTTSRQSGCDNATVGYTQPVLVCGAGLGRLAFEVARAGFVVEANEISASMLTAAHSLLNVHRIRCSVCAPSANGTAPTTTADGTGNSTSCSTCMHHNEDDTHHAEADEVEEEEEEHGHEHARERVGLEQQQQRETAAGREAPEQAAEKTVPIAATWWQFLVHGWLSVTRNNIRSDLRLLPSVIPDVPLHHPQYDDTLARLSFEHREFRSFYRQPAKFEMYKAVVSSFFLDATNDMIGSIAAVHNALAPNGLWANLGPLKYHHERSAHLAADELRMLVQAFGFRIDAWELRDVEYMPRSSNSMQPENYRALYFIAVKE